VPAPPKLAALFTVSAFTVAAKAGNDFLRFMKMLYRSIFLFALALLMGALTSRDARAIDTLRARLQTKLCPEYPRGGVIVELRYRVGINTALLPANVLSQVVDAATNTATFDIELPATNADTPLQLSATCVNRFGRGLLSNERSISACDGLALLDTDSDGLKDNFEDTNCNSRFDSADLASSQLVDSDLDGTADLIEVLRGTKPNWPGSSPRPFILKASAADFDGDQQANPVAWRPENGTWYIRDYQQPGNHLAIQWGLPGDSPFVYESPGYFSNVGVVRSTGQALRWYFRSPGFLTSQNTRLTEISFGTPSDILVPGAWQEAGVTSPAVASLVNNEWQIRTYLRNGSTQTKRFGDQRDVLKIADYDGDGLLDFGVYRATTQRVIYIRSSDSQQISIVSGSPTADYLIRGDFTGDGKSEIAFWEPLPASFRLVTSDSDFLTFAEVQLGIFNVHLPLSFNRIAGRDLFTVVDHNSGQRYWRVDNQPTGVIDRLQWGLPGDAQG